jgi:hypothetical protein
MVGIRTYNLATMKKLKNDSCKKVNKLFSEASGTNTNSTSGDNSTNNSVSAGGGGSTTGGNNSTASTSAVASPDQLENYDRCRGSGSSVDDCMKASGISNLAQTGGATDANLLSNPQVAGKLLENAPNLKDILKKAESGGASAALAGTLPPGGATDALAQLAAHAEQKGAELGGLLGMGMGAYSSGGGGGSSGGSKSDNPFSLFGAGAGGSAAAGSATQITTFGSVPGVMDIWHTGTTQNIFEIVSGKMSKVSNRVTPSTK